MGIHSSLRNRSTEGVDILSSKANLAALFWSLSKGSISSCCALLAYIKAACMVLTVFMYDVPMIARWKLHVLVPKVKNKLKLLPELWKSKMGWSWICNIFTRPKITWLMNVNSWYHTFNYGIYNQPRAIGFLFLISAVSHMTRLTSNLPN